MRISHLTNFTKLSATKLTRISKPLISGIMQLINTCGSANEEIQYLARVHTVIDITPALTEPMDGLGFPPKGLKTSTPYQQIDGLHQITPILLVPLGGFMIQTLSMLIPLTIIAT